MTLQQHQISWVVGVIRDCLMESQGDIEVGLSAFEYVLYTSPLPEANRATQVEPEEEKTIPQVKDVVVPDVAENTTLKKETKKLRRVVNKLKKLVKEQQENIVYMTAQDEVPKTVEHCGSEPPNDEPGWTYQGSAKWTKPAA